MAYIGIDRGIVKHWIYEDAEHFKVWFEILYRARFSNEPERKMIEGKLVTIEYGQFIFGRTSWSDRLKVSEQRLRTLFKKLQQDEMIELIQRFPKFSLYSVKNYEKYNQQTNQQQDQSWQEISDDGNQQNNNRPTSSQPAPNQQPTTQEESKKGKQGRNKVNKKKYAEFVSLSESEYQKLVEEHGEEFTRRCIVTLDNYKGAKGTKYKSDYRAILNWVVNRVKEDERKANVTSFNRHPQRPVKDMPVVTNDRSPKHEITPEERERMLARAKKLKDESGGDNGQGRIA